MLDLTIVTGMSGAGRSSTADALEDLGFFVIDNLPPSLIPKVAELAAGGGRPSRYALVVDVRSGAFMDDLEGALVDLRETGSRTQIFFLDASDPVLVRRFEASRRRHPLSAADSIIEGIQLERDLLEELKGQSDIVLDTTDLNVHQLRERVRELFGEGVPEPGDLQTNIVSFGYKHGVPVDVDLLFDCRFLPNPHWVEDLRPLPGTSAKVRRYVLRQPDAKAFLDRIEQLLDLLLPAYVREGKAYLSIGIGCTGGRHRSVVMALELGKVMKRLGFAARVHHRDLERV